jgi:hypothetical protein
MKSLLGHTPTQSAQLMRTASPLRALQVTELRLHLHSQFNTSSLQVEAAAVVESFKAVLVEVVLVDSEKRLLQLSLLQLTTL